MENTQDWFLYFVCMYEWYIDIVICLPLFTSCWSQAERGSRWMTTSCLNTYRCMRWLAVAGAGQHPSALPAHPAGRLRPP